MKRVSPVLFALSLLFIGWWIKLEIVSDYHFDRSIGSYWELGVKASTLQQKSAFLDQYIAAIEAEHLYGNDAILMPTPDNSYEQNMVALKSLQGRMHQIQGMDESSFAYQTAMQQITAQEQGEASHLTSTFKGIWFRQKHLFLYDWVDILMWLGMLVFAIITGKLAFS